MQSNQHPALDYAAEKARRYLAAMPGNPAEAQDTLTKVIIDAMISEARAARRNLCQKCATAYANDKRERGNHAMKTC